MVRTRWWLTRQGGPPMKAGLSSILCRRRRKDRRECDVIFLPRPSQPTPSSKPKTRNPLDLPSRSIPTLDMVKVWAKLKTSKSRLIGPNCPASFARKSQNRIMPARIHKEVPSALSRAPEPYHEAFHQLTQRRMPIHSHRIGGDPIIELRTSTRCACSTTILKLNHHHDRRNWRSAEEAAPSS